MVGFKDIYLLGRSNVGKSSLITALTGKPLRSGRRPGVTTSWSHVETGTLRYMDMPGFGFMSRMSRTRSEEIKVRIVRDLEERRDLIDLALLVLDARAFVEICTRWENRGEIPIDVEIHDFLQELEIPLLLVANKMDKVPDPDGILDMIGERLGYPSPWRQWGDVIVPVSAKTHAGISRLKMTISKKLSLV